MNPLSNRPQITSLPHDVLNEIVLRLPEVNSKKPWHDLNSLASSCRFLSQWKTEGVKPLLNQAWSQASKILKNSQSWQAALLRVLDQPFDPASRLFREPVLRKYASRRRRVEEGDVSETYPTFIALVGSHRESVSVAELRHYLTVCKKSSQSQRMTILATVPRLLEELTEPALEQACRVLAKFLVKEKVFCRRLAHSGEMEKLLNAAGRSKRGFALLELSLLAQDSLPYPMSELEVQQTLSTIPKKLRWEWISTSVPQFFQSGALVRCLLVDAYCRTQMIKFMYAAFSEDRSDMAKLAACECAYEGRAILGAIEKGRDLLGLLSDWITNSAVFKVDGNRALKERFVLVITHFADAICKYSTKGTSGQLSKQMRLAIEYAVGTGKLDQATSILCAMGANMRLPVNGRIRGDEARLTRAFTGAFRKAADYTDRYGRIYYCNRLIELVDKSRLGKENVRRLKLEVKNAMKAKQSSEVQVQHRREFDSASES